MRLVGKQKWVCMESGSVMKWMADGAVISIDPVHHMILMFVIILTD